MKNTLLLVSYSMATLAAAQPTFNMADVVPPFGPSVVVRIGDYVDPGPTGANFTYDVSNLTLGTPSQSQFMAPSATPYGASFPQATLASTALTNPSLYTYTQYTSAGGFNWGFYRPESHFVMTDPEKSFQFPLVNGATWTDAFSGTGANSGQSFTRSGSTTCAYNGYGTIILPFGTFTNVARFEVVQSYTDNYAGALDMVYEVRTIGYMIPGLYTSLFSVAQVFTDFGSGEEPILFSTASIMIDPAEVGIHELAGTGPSAVLMPNPASDAITVVMDPAVAQGPVTIALEDAMGRAVRVLQPRSAVAATSTFDVSDLPRGMYLVRVSDDEGRSTTTRLVLR